MDSQGTRTHYLQINKQCSDSSSSTTTERIWVRIQPTVHPKDNPNESLDRLFKYLLRPPPLTLFLLSHCDYTFLSLSLSL